jgi:hypothetical protein
VHEAVHLTSAGHARSRVRVREHGLADNDHTARQNRGYQCLREVVESDLFGVQDAEEFAGSEERFPRFDPERVDRRGPTQWNCW